MKKTKKYILAGVLSILVISGLLAEVKSLAFANESANGQGKLVNEDGSQSQFNFTAQRNPNGKVTGQASLRNPSYKTSNGQNELINIDISCLKIVGNVAVIGGWAKRKNSQTKAEAVYFAVEDGRNSGADKIFRGFYFDDDPNTDGDAQLCQTLETDVLVLEPIADGNILVNR